MNIPFVQADNTPCGRDASRQRQAAWRAYKISCAQELVYWFLGGSGDREEESCGQCPAAATVTDGGASTSLQLACQHLTYQVLAKAVMRFFFDQLEACFVVDAARIGEDAIRPQDQYLYRFTKIRVRKAVVVN